MSYYSSRWNHSYSPAYRYSYDPPPSPAYRRPYSRRSLSRSESRSDSRDRTRSNARVEARRRSRSPRRSPALSVSGSRSGTPNNSRGKLVPAAPCTSRRRKRSNSLSPEPFRRGIVRKSRRREPSAESGEISEESGQPAASAGFGLSEEEKADLFDLQRTEFLLSFVDRQSEAQYIVRTAPPMSPASDEDDDDGDNLPEKARVSCIALTDRVEWGWVNLSIKVLSRKHAGWGGLANLANLISDYASRRPENKDVSLLDQATELVHILPIPTLRRVPKVLATMDMSRFANIKAAAQLLLETTCRREYCSAGMATWQQNLLRYAWYEAPDETRYLFHIVRDILFLSLVRHSTSVMSEIAAKLVKEYGPPQSWFSSRDMLARRQLEGTTPFTTHDALVIVFHEHHCGCSSIYPESTRTTFDDYLLDPYTLARVRAYVIKTETDRRREAEKKCLGAGRANLR